MKQCTKCGEWKQSKHFCKNKNKKDGLDCWCRECKKEYIQSNKEKVKSLQKQWYKNNKERIKKQSKEYKQNNKEWYKEYNKEWYKDNKENIKEYKREYTHSPVPFDSKSKLTKEIKLYEEIKESSYGNLMCKCAYCGGWFEPTRLQIRHRAGAANGVGNVGGECRLYCKDGCKQACPTYRQRLYPKDMKPGTAREVQPELRKMVIERDNYTCQKCNTHNDDLEVELHCHHIEGIQWEPLQSADIDMCITFCADCHVEVHKIPGCGYQDMQCK